MTTQWPSEAEEWERYIATLPPEQVKAIETEEERLRKLGEALNPDDVVEVMPAYCDPRDPYVLWPRTEDWPSHGVFEDWFALTLDGRCIWSGDIASEKCDRIAAKMAAQGGEMTSTQH